MRRSRGPHTRHTCLVLLLLTVGASSLWFTVSRGILSPRLSQTALPDAAGFFADKRRARCSNPNETIAYTLPSSHEIGRPMQFSSASRHMLDTYCDIQDAPSTINPSKVAVVTAITADHFEEAQDMFRSVRKCRPDLHLIVVDMGLKRSQADFISSRCNLHLVTMDWSLFPKYVSFITEYRFKPVAIHLAFQDHWGLGWKPDAVLWMDASVRLRCGMSYPWFSGRWQAHINEADNRGVAWCDPMRHKSFYFIPPGMYKILPASSLVRDGYMFGADCLLISRATRHVDSVFFWWLACALEPTCMLDKTDETAPWFTGDPNVRGQNDGRKCHMTFAEAIMLPTRKSKPFNCTRTDQSALNLLWINAHGRHRWLPRISKTIREPTNFVHRKYLNECLL